MAAVIFTAVAADTILLSPLAMQIVPLLLVSRQSSVTTGSLCVCVVGEGGGGEEGVKGGGGGGRSRCKYRALLISEGSEQR